MTRPELVPATLPTLPTAQLLARLSAEPGRCEMTLDPASPWVAGVIVRTPRFLMALHAVNPDEAQIIVSPRVPGLQGSGDAQLQALLANAAPAQDAAYRPVPPPDVSHAAPPPLPTTPDPVKRPTSSRVDLPLVLTWGLLAALIVVGASGGLAFVATITLIGAVLMAFVGSSRRTAAPGASTFRSVSLVAGLLGVLLLFAGQGSVMPLVLLLAVVSAVSGHLPRLGAGRWSGSAPASGQASTGSAATAEGAVARALPLPAPQLQLIESARARLTEHLVEAERSGSPRDVFEARQALEVHLPEVLERWEALPSWRRRDDAPLRRTLEGLATVSLPDTTSSELDWDATERFIEQKARARGASAGDLPLKREPLTPPTRTPDMDQTGHVLVDPSKENS